MDISFFGKLNHLIWTVNVFLNDKVGNGIANVKFKKVDSKCYLTFQKFFGDVCLKSS